jgi:hypothetical protein
VYTDMEGISDREQLHCQPGMIDTDLTLILQASSGLCELRGVNTDHFGGNKLYTPGGLLRNYRAANAIGRNASGSGVSVNASWSSNTQLMVCLSTSIKR